MRVSVNSLSNQASQVTQLKAQLRAAQRRISDLERQIGRSNKIRLDPVEVDLLRLIADADAEDVFEVNLAEATGLPKARLDYHLRRLVRAQFVIVSYTDPELGESFQITQKGAKVLIDKRLL